MAVRLNFNVPEHSGMTSARTRARLAERLRASGIADEALLGVMAEVPRHAFVDQALAHRAYDDVSLPIGYSQTISQPYIVARMTELVLGASGRQKVLEIGTGCGYQTTVLAQFFHTVHSIERVGGLARAARERLAGLGVRNVRLRHGDGSQGWANAAPFDAIMITAAAPILPEALIGQLAVGGRLVFPVGVAEQELRMIERTADGCLETRLEKVRFVPLLPGVA
ncbi:protein-L-isoaspartate(D-aspartate) O-methyltransferase [Chitiniphilus purpureus]|uniref:Protein-L-isoaspartate O-methyltransferase n=2 Tax=Chitiniphilus purpureus TaxID=2981137 RepID=A0ABY6DI60_9NEIS|nr:protein-L-isoaspartate(D-aspartate) O-methyltransferase [Chitiniphilus sp. CD1]UXY14011.1 protein-L-isoaspartate(D-aspartate) O-methyltransferase [Chitiniphilus sp. CD1]